MNNLTPRNATGLPATKQRNPFLEHADSVLQRNIVGKLLKFSKGDWFAGQNAEEVPVGTQFVVNMGEMLKGWQRWENFKPTDQVMGKVSDGFQPPLRSELPDQDKSLWEINSDGNERDPWQKTNYLLLKGVADGELYTFTASSKGGLDAVALLCRAWGPSMVTRPKEWPIVSISGDSYPHPIKERGRIKYPVFTIVGWAPKTVFDADLGEVVHDDDADVDEIPEVAAPKPAAKKNRI